jgi:serine protease
MLKRAATFAVVTLALAGAVASGHTEPAKAPKAETTASKLQRDAQPSAIKADPRARASTRDEDTGRDRSRSGVNVAGRRDGQDAPKAPTHGTHPDAFEIEEDEVSSGTTATEQTNDPNNLINVQNKVVQTKPVVYTVFWGNWSASTATYRGRLLNFFDDVGGTQYGKVLTQYRQGCYSGTATCTGAAAGNPSSVYGGYWYDTSSVPAHPTMAQIQAEGARAARAFGDFSYNAQYVVVLPPGHFDQYSLDHSACAWHYYSLVDSTRWVTVTSLPYQFDNTCGSWNNVNGFASHPYDAVSVVAGHEYAESVTDPAIQGWRDKVSGEENADKCTLVRGNVTLSGYVYPMQATWSNAHKNAYGRGCALVW